MFLATNISTGLNRHHDAQHNSLSDTQAQAIEQALASGWTIDRHVSFDERLALMLTIDDACDADTVFYVDAAPDGLVFSVLRDDVLEHCGCYGSVDSLVAAIRTVAQGQALGSRLTITK